MSECTKWAVDIAPAQAARGLPPHLGFVLDALILVSNVACDSAVLPLLGHRPHRRPQPPPVGRVRRPVASRQQQAAGVKALTLWQPHAQLVALGVKTIETRSWSTDYRGPLAIHAGTRRPPFMHLPPYIRPRSRDDDEPRFLCCDTITDHAYHGPQPVSPVTGRQRRIPKRAQTPTLFFPRKGPHGRPWDSEAGTSATEQETAVYLPLGAIVATCTLVDVVPMKAHTESTADQAAHLIVGTRHHPDRLLLARPSQGWSTDAHGVATHFEWATEVVTEQRPYGDYTPGRYAWLLADIEPRYVPNVRGRQGLWNWTPE